MELYLAGPDVFRPDVREWAQSARALCEGRGHRALLPVDKVLADPAEIYRHNVALIREADALLANLAPFRGAEPDSGTAFEVGFALALGKRVIGYVERGELLRERVARSQAGVLRQDAAGWLDAQGWRVEDFGLPLNLMLAVPIELVTGGLEAALQRLD